MTPVSLLVRQRDGKWEAWTGAPNLDRGKVEALVRDGVWGEADLLPYGLKVAEPFVPPEGKQIAGEASYVEDKGVVSEVHEVEDIPPPPLPPTREEKVARLLADYGLTLDDLKSAAGGEATAAKP
jgi:hypothetical protein